MSDLNRIIDVASDIFLISREVLCSKNRFKHVVKARHGVAYVLRLHGHTTVAIGRALGYTDHSTISHAVKAAKIRIQRDERYRQRIERLAAVQ